MEIGYEDIKEIRMEKSVFEGIPEDAVNEARQNALLAMTELKYITQITRRGGITPSTPVNKLRIFTSIGKKYTSGVMFMEGPGENEVSVTSVTVFTLKP